MRIPRDTPHLTQPVPYVGHHHFWQRAMARRQFIRVGAGVTALALGAGLGGALPALAAPSSDLTPKPIPGGIPLGQIVGFPGDKNIYHVSGPAFGFEASTITDFTGFIAAADIRGTGTSSDSSGANPATLYFDADMRFMQGTYVGVDGKTHQNTFGFI